MILRQRRSQRDHTWAQENLSAYLDGALSLNHKARLERHLAGCAECRQSLHTLKQTVALLRRMPAVPAPVSFILPASAQRRQMRYRQWQMAFGALRTAAVAVSVMLAILLSADALLTSGILSTPTKSAERISAPIALEAQYTPPEAAPTSTAHKPTLAPSITPSLPAARVAMAQPTASPPLADDTAPQAPVALQAAPSAPSPTPAVTAEVASPTLVEAAPPQAPVAAAFPSAKGGSPGVGGAGGAGGAEGSASGVGSGAAAEGMPALAQEPAELKATPPFEPSTLLRGPLPSPSPILPLPTESTPLPSPISLLPAGSTPAPTQGQALALVPLATPTPGPEQKGEISPSPVPTKQVSFPEPTARIAESSPKGPLSEAAEPSAILQTFGRTVRLTAVGLFGALLILLGSLLWVGQRRHR